MNKIEIIGLGTSDLDQMPLGIWKRLVKAEKIYLRTDDHPAVRALADEGVETESFDHLYEQNDNFEDTYQAIVNSLVEEARKRDVIYAVPGHPMFYETTTELLLEKSGSGEIEVEISGGQSFIDVVIGALKVPVNEGFQVIDGMSFSMRDLNYSQHTLVTQVYDTFSLGEVKLTLLEYYSSGTRVKLIDAAGSSDEKIYELPLHEIDHLDIKSNLLCLYIPKTDDVEVAERDIYYMAEAFDTLVGENGCPWDKIQTHETLEKHLIEETFEVIEAIEHADDDAIVEELGDILLQVALHSAIGKKEGYFDFFDVLQSLNAKIVRRHPHVFGDEDAESLDDLNRIWSAAKKKEGKKEKIKYEKEYGEKVLEWMKETIHEKRTLEEILNKRGE
ncbi:MazG nucleotide pyrophosphohydrolase domain-containing protein [Salinicoccus sp. HZC-1]|uniref:MazG nucleotide pyrophosphohydrolase domain-containing protein n=1 Tax=Salinicoccus sp. HZC-1 TaxID=3385497 RepID=UPI00398B65D3